MNYYNEHDPKMAAWIRGLIGAGLIPDGHVDERSIVDVEPSELQGYTQCHFFAGIAGWSYALQLARWPKDRPVWTGSCPCQPYSVAGKGKGNADERNLWPAFFRLIRECRPDTVFGEQVESAVGHGWLDGVSTDLEGEGYAVGPAVLGAHSVGAPHIRQRLYWVADFSDHGLQRAADSAGTRGGAGAAHSGRLVFPLVEGLEGHTGHGDSCDESGRVGAREDGSIAAAGCGAGRMGDASGPGPQGRRVSGPGEGAAIGRAGAGCGGLGDSDITGFIPRGETSPTAGYGDSSDAASFWSDFRLIQCRDGKLRRIPVEPVFQFVSDGISCIMGSGWNSQLTKSENLILTHAEKTKRRPIEMLYSLWNHYYEKALRENLGGHGPLSCPEVLLFAMCQLAGRMGQEFECATSCFATITQKTMRVLRRGKGVKADACSPSERELEGSQTGESPNTVHSLPLREGPLQERAEEVPSLRSEESEAADVSEALPEMEEVWRPFFDETKSGGEAIWMRNRSGIIRATSCFPLADGLPYRVGKRGSVRPALLHGAGNAIVPQVAAEFIRAYIAYDLRRRPQRMDGAPENKAP